MKLTVQNVSLSRAGQSVLQNVSFCAQEGQITALIGRNGAGKTSLLRALTGEYSKYSGQFLLDDTPIHPLSPAQRSLLLSCLPQNLPTPHVTVEELVGFGRTPYTPLSGKLSDRDREKIRWAIHTVGLDAHAEQFVDTLSGGERKKAFFAMTLAQDTPLVVLDEPTAHLDTVSRFEFLELLDRLRQETGKTFLVVLHDLPEVIRYAQHIVTLHQGEITFDGTPQCCLEENIPQTYFQIRLTGDFENGFAVTPVP